LAPPARRTIGHAASTSSRRGDAWGHPKQPMCPVVERTLCAVLRMNCTASRGRRRDPGARTRARRFHDLENSISTPARTPGELLRHVALYAALILVGILQ